MVELWLRPPFLTPGRKVAITFCFRLAGRTLGCIISTSAVASHQDCGLRCTPSPVLPMISWGALPQFGAGGELHLESRTLA
jgi:hypothetical protein